MTKFENNVATKSLLSKRSLLKACDDCGVVKSENSVIRNCKAELGTALISSSLTGNIQIAI